MAPYPNRQIDRACLVAHSVRETAGGRVHDSHAHVPASFRAQCSGYGSPFSSARGSASNGSTTLQSVDAATFALAVQQGRGDEYKGRIIAGTGADFHGSAPSLERTVGSAVADRKPKPVTTWDDFVAAQRARSTLVLSLDVAGFQRTSWPKRGQPPVEY